MNKFAPIFAILAIVSIIGYIIFFIFSRNDETRELIAALRVVDLEKTEELLKTHPNLANSKDQYGRGPMHFIVFQASNREASHYNNKEKSEPIPVSQSLQMIDLLIKHGCDINQKDNSGFTPIRWPILHENESHMENRYEILHYLIAKGASVHPSGDNFNIARPLLWALENRKTEAASILIKHGADPNKKDKAGKTMFDHSSSLGIKNEYQKALELLKPIGAIKTQATQP